MVDTVNQFIVKLSQRGDPPVKVAEVVHHALTAKHPKTRYRPGKHASTLKLVSQFVPDKVRDFFINQEIKRRSR
jgi:hypothetical protein